MYIIVTGNTGYLNIRTIRRLAFFRERREREADIGGKILLPTLLLLVSPASTHLPTAKHITLYYTNCTMKISKLLKKSSKKKSLPPSSTSVQRKKKSQDPTVPPLSSPPTRKNVTFVANANGRPVEDDEISAMTRGTDMPESPDRSSSYGKTYNYNNNVSPQPLPSSGFSNDDDSSSQDLLVFEDKTDDSLGSLPGIATSKVVASGLSGSEKSPLRVRFSEDSITMSAAAGTTSRQLFDYSNTKKSSKQNQQQSSSSKLRSSAISKLVKKKASYLTNTEYFRNTVNSAVSRSK